jgi:hypothetical protein
MSANHLYQFRISYRINGTVHLNRIEGINLRHAKEKIAMKYPDATDLMDWTNEKDAELKHFLRKSRMAVRKFTAHLKNIKEADDLHSLSAASQ